MSNKIILKKSSVTSKTPASGDLEYGELALNYADGRLYYKTSTNTIASFNAGSVGGTVTSVAVTSTDLIVSGSPITSSGTLTLDLNTVPVSKGGTGQTTQQTALNALAGATTANRVLRGDGTNVTLSQVVLTSDVTGTLAVANGGTGVTTSTGTGSVVLSDSPTLITPLLGTPTSVVLTNATGLPLSTGVTGTLSIANGGTGQISFSSGYLKSNGSALSSISTISASDITGTVSAASTVQNNGAVSSTATHYIVFVSNNTTSTQAINTNSSLSYNPSTGVLTAAEYSVTQGTNGSAALITTTTATNQVVDSVSASVYRTVKYVLQVSSGAAYQTSEILLIHDDTNAYLTEYATIKTTTNTLATFDATISGGNLQLLVSPTNTITTVRAVRTAINI